MKSEAVAAIGNIEKRIESIPQIPSCVTASLSDSQRVALEQYANQLQTIALHFAIALHHEIINSDRLQSELEREKAMVKALCDDIERTSKLPKNPRCINIIIPTTTKKDDETLC